MALTPLIKRLLKPITLWLATLVVVAAVLLFFEADLLWKVQQHNVFLDTTMFFQQMMAMPGGMLEWLATYFSQHFYYPWVGVIILCGWWLLLMWLTKRAFNIPDRWTVLTLVPVAILIVANMCLGYWIYVIKLPGYFYVATIGTTALAALLWAYRILNEKLEMKGTRLIPLLSFLILGCVVGYPLMGVYALAAVALMAVMAWRKDSLTLNNKVLISIVALVSIVAVPLFYYHYVYCGTNIIDLWRTGIPVFEVADSYPMYYLPYYALGLCFLLLAATYRERKLKTPSSAEPKPNAKKQHKTQKAKGTTITSYILPLTSYIVIAGAVYYFWYKDANFHHELRMQRCVEQADWEGVVAEGTKQEGEPTRAIVMMHNLALSRLGRQCDEMYRFPKGSKKSNTPLPIFMYNVAGRMMLYQYGSMNECHRVCMEEGVEYGWNVEQLQYLARAAIFNKEPQAARKFLDILRQTSYYGDWADHMEALLNDPKQLAQDSETGPITHMMHYTDRLDAVEGYVEKTLMNNLASQDADDIYFQEQAVLAAMWTRNPDLFWPRFEHYVKLNGEEIMPPRIFQEAAWLFANMQGQQGLDEWVLEPGVKEGLNGFMKQMQRFRKTPSSNAKSYMLAYFGTTYYFEYFFLKDITYY
jgi:hypothetical protein